MSIEWDGKGLPPIGCECEIAKPIYNAGTRVRVLCIDDGAAVCRILEGDRIHSLCQLEVHEIKPTKATRESVGQSLFNAINWNHEDEPVSDSRMEDYRKAYDAIAAGKIPGIRLTDD